MTKKRTLTIINPHLDGSKIFGSVANYISRARNYKTYAHYFQILEDDPDLRINFCFLTGSVSFPFYFPFLLEIALFYILNRLNPITFRASIFNPKKPRPISGDAFVFSHLNLDKEDGDKMVNLLKQVDGHCIIHVSHFHRGTKFLRRNLEKIDRKILVSEMPLSKCSPFFRDKVSNSNVQVINHKIQKRFVRIRENECRRHSCAVSGSYYVFRKDERSADFFDYFDGGNLHPNRELFYNNRLNCGDIATVKIEKYDDLAGENKNYSNRIFRKMASARRFLLSKSQPNYFKFDIVEFFNSHKFASVPIEITGVISISVFEAMACGSVIISERADVLEHIGLREGEHFLSYDGSLEDFRRTIRGSTDENQLAKIRENSLAFIRKYSCEEELKKQIMDVFLR
jgi:hypothetical protein